MSSNTVDDASLILLISHTHQIGQIPFTHFPITTSKSQGGARATIRSSLTKPSSYLASRLIHIVWSKIIFMHFHDWDIFQTYLLIIISINSIWLLRLSNLINLICLCSSTYLPVLFLHRTHNCSISICISCLQRWRANYRSRRSQRLSMRQWLCRRVRLQACWKLEVLISTWIELSIWNSCAANSTKCESMHVNSLGTQSSIWSLIPSRRPM